MSILPCFPQALSQTGTNTLLLHCAVDAPCPGCAGGRCGWLFATLSHWVLLWLCAYLCGTAYVRVGALLAQVSLSAHRPQSVCTWAACVAHPGCQVCGVMPLEGSARHSTGQITQGFQLLVTQLHSWAAMHVGEVPVVFHGQGVPAAGRVLHVARCCEGLRGVAACIVVVVG